MFKVKENVLFIAPHPDDVFISCGGYIIDACKNTNIHICCLSTKGMQPSDEIRISEEVTAWSSIDSEIKLTLFENGIDTRLEESYNKIVSFIESLLKEYNYDVKYIFTPAPNDTHQDHRAVSNATLSACRYAKNVIFYETPSTYNFVPTMFYEMSENVMKRKMHISNCYQSQILGNSLYAVDLQTLIESKAISNGLRTRTCKYAEGFQPFRLFI